MLKEGGDSTPSTGSAWLLAVPSQAVLASASAYGPRTPGGISWTNGPNLGNFGAYAGTQVVYTTNGSIVPSIRPRGSSDRCSPRGDVFQFHVGERHYFRIAGRCRHCGLLIGIHSDGYEVHFHPGKVAVYPHRL